MENLKALLDALFGLFINAGSIAFVPGLIAYFVEKSILKNGNPPTRYRVIAVIAAVLFIGSMVGVFLGNETGAAIWIFAFMLVSTLMGVVIGGKAAQSDFRRKHKPS